MNSIRISTYEKNIQTYSDALKKAKQKHAIVSIIRLAVFVAALLSWFYLLTLNITLGSSLGTLFIVAFLLLIKVHKNLEDKRNYLETIIKLNKHELDCCNGNFSNFEDGSEYVDSSHPYSYDMDLFGKGSLFQYLNRTITNGGKKLLSNWLSNTPLKSQTIKQNQEAIEELSHLIEFRQEFYTVGKLHKSTDDEGILIKRWIDQSSFFSNKKIIGVLLWLIPTINLSLLCLIIAGYLSWSILTFIILINLSIVGLKFTKFNKKYLLLSKSHANLKKMTLLFNLVEKLEVKSQLLSKLHSQFYKNNRSAGEQVNKLTKLLDSLDNRNNIILGIILNAFLLWDWNYLWRIEKWKKSHQMDYDNWQSSLSYFDALISLANLTYNNTDFTFPTITNGEYEFKANEIGHPLLPKDVRICNDFDISEKQRYAIITGANMAGKSTFLRTVALNLILSGCGAPACAKSISFTPLPLYSSMRAEDSLMKNESYFFAELKRLQRITQELDKGEKMFIILDEILRGTNSEDKRKGSIGFVKKITSKLAYGLVATHDLELARLAEQQPDVFKALCFEVAIENNELQFDYKLELGVTQNMNASFLMKSMGIIDDEQK